MLQILNSSASSHQKLQELAAVLQAVSYPPASKEATIVAAICSHACRCCQEPVIGTGGTVESSVNSSNNLEDAMQHLCCDLLRKCLSFSLHAGHVQDLCISLLYVICQDVGSCPRKPTYTLQQ